MATEYVAHHLDWVASTQDEARQRFDGAPCLVTAQGQRAGRGRAGAEWLTAPRSLAASLAFTAPAWPGSRVPVLTLVAGLAARRVLGEALLLKWPNDLVTAGGDKVAGLLAERTGELIVIGLGANLYWPEPPPGFGAVSPSDPGPEAGPARAVLWTEQLLARIGAGPEEWGIAEYRACSSTIGTLVTWEGGGRALAVDVDELGGLVVEADGERMVLRSGQVRSLRPTTLTDDQEDGRWHC